jgi:hypothetical protein
MFNDVSSPEPRPPVFNANPQLNVGGNGPTPNWFSRLLGKLWPPLASMRYKVFLLGGVSLGLLAIIGGAIFTFNALQPPAPTTNPGSSEQTSNNNGSSNSGSTGTTTPTPSPDTSVTDNSSTPTGSTPTKKSTSKSTGGTSSSSGSSSSGSGSTGGSGDTGGGTTPPPSCDLPNYPTATCTGVPAGTSLTVVSGDLHITTPGTIVDSKDIQGCVFIEAPNVTIRKSKITCGFAFGIHALSSNYTGGGLIIQDTELTCNENTATAIAGYGFVATRLNVHGCENGFSIDNDATVQDSYIHDLFHDVGSHTDGIQLSGGANVTITHNKIFNQDPDGTSAIISNDTGLSNVHIANNLLAGGGHTLYCPSVSSSDFHVTGNHFSREFFPNSGSFSAMVYCEFVTEATGNVWDDTGLPVPF